MDGYMLSRPWLWDNFINNFNNKDIAMNKTIALLAALGLVVAAPAFAQTSSGDPVNDAKIASEALF